MKFKPLLLAATMSISAHGDAQDNYDVGMRVAMNAALISAINYHCGFTAVGKYAIQTAYHAGVALGVSTDATEDMMLTMSSITMDEWSNQIMPNCTMRTHFINARLVDINTGELYND